MAVTDEAIGKIKGMLVRPPALERMVAEHQAILQAVMAGDADLARSWATVHVSGIESWFRTTRTA